MKNETKEKYKTIEEKLKLQILQILQTEEIDEVCDLISLFQQKYPIRRIEYSSYIINIKYHSERKIIHKFPNSYEITLTDGDDNYNKIENIKNKFYNIFRLNFNTPRSFEDFNKQHSFKELKSFFLSITKLHNTKEKVISTEEIIKELKIQLLYHLIIVEKIQKPSINNFISNSVFKFTRYIDTKILSIIDNELIEDILCDAFVKGSKIVIETLINCKIIATNLLKLKSISKILLSAIENKHIEVAQDLSNKLTKKQIKSFLSSDDIYRILDILIKDEHLEFAKDLFDKFTKNENNYISYSINICLVFHTIIKERKFEFAEDLFNQMTENQIQAKLSYSNRINTSVDPINTSPNPINISRILYDAIKEKNLKFVQYLFNKFKENQTLYSMDISKILCEAIKKGYIEFVKDIFNQFTENQIQSFNSWDVYIILFSAIKNEYIELAQYLFNKFTENQALYSVDISKILCEAIKKGYIEFVKDAFNQFTENQALYSVDISKILCEAIKNEYIELAQYLFNKFTENQIQSLEPSYISTILDKAIKNEHLEFVKDAFNKLSKYQIQSLEPSYISTILGKTIEKGDIEFIERLSPQLTSNQLKNITESDFIKGEIEKILSHNFELGSQLEKLFIKIKDLSITKTDDLLTDDTLLFELKIEKINFPPIEPLNNSVIAMLEQREDKLDLKNQETEEISENKPDSQDQDAQVETQHMSEDQLDSQDQGAQVATQITSEDISEYKQDQDNDAESQATTIGE